MNEADLVALLELAENALTQLADDVKRQEDEPQPEPSGRQGES